MADDPNPGVRRRPRRGGGRRPRLGQLGPVQAQRRATEQDVGDGAVDGKGMPPPNHRHEQDDHGEH